MDEYECPLCKSEDVEHFARDPDSDAEPVDRECNTCGTRWAYVTPTWVGWTYIGLGVLFMVLMYLGGRWLYVVGLEAQAAAAAEGHVPETTGPLAHTRLTVDAVWGGVIIGLAAGLGIGMLGILIKVLQHGVAVTCNNAGAVSIIHEGSPPEEADEMAEDQVRPA